jgi:hypothetical protein
LKTPPRISGCPNFARTRDHAQRGLVDLGQPLEDPAEALQHHVRAIPEVVVELEAGREVLAGAEEHDQLDVTLVLERLDGHPEFLQHLYGKDVGGRTVQRDADDAFGGLELDVLEGPALLRSEGIDILAAFEVFHHARVGPFLPAGGASRLATNPRPHRVYRGVSLAQSVPRGARTSHAAGRKPGASNPPGCPQMRRRPICRMMARDRARLRARREGA